MKYKITYIFYFTEKDGGKITRKATKVYEEYDIDKQIKHDLAELNKKFPHRDDYCYTKQLVKEEG